MRRCRVSAPKIGGSFPKARLISKKIFPIQTIFLGAGDDWCDWRIAATKTKQGGGGGAQMWGGGKSWLLLSAEKNLLIVIISWNKADYYPQLMPLRSADFVSMLCKDRAEILTSTPHRVWNMVHQWEKTSIEANQSPPWGSRISPLPIAGTFGLINYYGIFLISFITGWCLIILANEGTCVADDFLVFEGNFSVFSIVLWANSWSSWVIWRFLDFDQIGSIGIFYSSSTAQTFFRGENVPLKKIFEG